MGFDQTLNVAVPYILIVIVIGFVWSKFNKPIKELYETISTWLKPKHKKETDSNYYNYIDYE